MKNKSVLRWRCMAPRLPPSPPPASRILFSQAVLPMSQRASASGVDPYDRYAVSVACSDIFVSSRG